MAKTSASQPHRPQESRESKLAPRTDAEVANDKENKSSSSRFSTYERVPGKGLDGDLIIEHRGEPKSGVPSPGE